MNEPFCPSEFWNYNYSNKIEIKEKDLSSIKIKGKEELQNLYSKYLKSTVHSSLIKIMKEIDEIGKIKTLIQ